jgi:hypothetical protein
VTLCVRRKERTSGIVACAQTEQAVRAIELSTLGWTVIVAAHFLGMLNLPWFDIRREQVFYSASDLCVKFGYSYLLCDAYIHIISLEETHRKQITLKEAQIFKQRAFLRYGLYKTQETVSTACHILLR